MTKDKKEKLGDEAPTWKDVAIVFIVAGILIGLSWIAWFKLGWFH